MRDANRPSDKEMKEWVHEKKEPMCYVTYVHVVLAIQGKWFLGEEKGPLRRRKSEVYRGKRLRISNTYSSGKSKRAGKWKLECIPASEDRSWDN